MKAMILAFLLSATLTIALSQAQSQVTNPTVQYANQTVSNAAYYLSQVNESGYLIFYPNLTQAYVNLLKAESIYNTSPASAVVLANKAVSEASTEYARIGTYKTESAVATGAFVVFFAFLLSRSTRRMQKGTRSRRSK